MGRDKRIGRAPRAVLAVATALGAMLALPALALAEEGGSNGLALLTPNPIEFVPMIIAFFIMWFVFAKFVYPTVMGMIDKRADTIRTDLENAEENKVASARLLEQRQEQLEGARDEAARIVADAKKSAEAAKAQIEADARAEAQSIIEKAHAAVEAERKAAVMELQGSMADISISVAERLIGQDLSDDEHRAIIERYVKEAGSLNAV